MIILNKMDVPDAADMADLQEEELKEFGWPIFRISTVAHKGLDELKYALLDIVKAHRKANPVEEKPAQVITPKGLRKRSGGRFADFEVEVDPSAEDAFIVRGEKIERWIRQTDFENDEAVGYLADRLAKAGVEEALYKAGADAGSEVTIGEITFEWDPQTAAGVDVMRSGRGTDIRLEQNTRATPEERKRASQARRGLIDENDFGDGEVAERERWQG